MISIIISALTAGICLFTHGWPIVLPLIGLALGINAILKKKMRSLAIACTALNGLAVSIPLLIRIYNR